jgi:hypothetical protein
MDASIPLPEAISEPLLERVGEFGDLLDRQFPDHNVAEPVAGPGGDCESTAGVRFHRRVRLGIADDAQQNGPRPGEQDAGCFAAVAVGRRAPARGREQRRSEQGQRERPFQFLGEHGVRQPTGEQFPCPAAVAPEGAAGELERPRGGERRRGDVPRRRPARPRSLLATLRRLGGPRRRRRPRSRIAIVRPIRPRARARPAAGVPPVPDRRPAGRGGARRAAPPRLRCGRRAQRWRQAPAQGGFSLTMESSRASAAPARKAASASVSGGFFARPGRERRRRGGGKTRGCGRIGAREPAGRRPVAALLASSERRNRRARRRACLSDNALSDPISTAPIRADFRVLF